MMRESSILSITSRFSSSILLLFFSLILRILFIGTSENHSSRKHVTGRKNTPQQRLFFQKHGWPHRLSGMMNMCWLFFGLLFFLYQHDAEYFGSERNNDNEFNRYRFTSSQWRVICMVYDIVLGLLGTIATYTAAKHFPHYHIQNKKGVSGTLAESAIVTQHEMIEHLFYQLLNLIQAIYFHILPTTHSNLEHWQTLLPNNVFLTPKTKVRFSYGLHVFLCFAFVTCPWIVRRSHFPVHSFSANWRKEHHPQQKKQILSLKKQKDTTSMNSIKCFDSSPSIDIELLLYKIKKSQYIFYKHVVFFGMNLCALTCTLESTPDPFIVSHSWRIFWLALNTSYVFEFFLQTLVKRQIISQIYMLNLQRLLMSGSMFAAFNMLAQNIFYLNFVDGLGEEENIMLYLFGGSSWSLPITLMTTILLSIFLNFYNRGHDFLNMMFLGTVYILLLV